MRIGSSWEKDKRWMVVDMAAPVATEPAVTLDLSVQNCIMNEARDRAHLFHPHFPNLLSDGMNKIDGGIENLRSNLARLHEQGN